MVGIYHSRDLDGWASGAIIKLKYPDAKMIGFDYGERLELEVGCGPIIMADVSLPMPQMLVLAKHSNWAFTWIDHHISAIKDYKEFIGEGEAFCNAVLDNTISACEGTWKHLFPDKEMPEAIKLLGEYDSWRNADKERWDKRIMPFQFGMRSLCNSVETFPLELFIPNSQLGKTILDEIWTMGRGILRYQATINESQCKRAAFAYNMPWEGKFLRCICLNGSGFNSETFKSVWDESKYDVMVPFQLNGKHWTFSLYTTKDDIDCSLIAKSRGGGGHKKAAGFETPDISSVFPFINHLST